MYGSAEGRLRGYLRKKHPEFEKPMLMQKVRATAAPPELRSALVRGSQGLLPTLPSSIVYHPVILCEMRYLSVYSYLELFGILPTDPLAVHLLQTASKCDLDCARSLGTLCQGVSGHSICALLGMIKQHSPISRLKRWRLATSFSGGDTFSCHLRRFGQDVVAAATRSLWNAPT